MRIERKKTGFSLTEVLLAVGTLAIGMIFIGGTFIAGIHFSTIATERTIAAIVADEAFAKIKLYGIKFNSTSWPAPLTTACVDFNNVSGILPESIATAEFAYPSTLIGPAEKQYFWSAICRRVAPDPARLVQVTVFISRKAGRNTKYHSPADPFNSVADYPMPVKVDVTATGDANELRITDYGTKNWINDGYTIVDDENGRIYRVLERYPSPEDDIIRLSRPWDPGIVSDMIWIVPPPVGSGRNPCIAVYQTVIRFLDLDLVTITEKEQ